MTHSRAPRTARSSRKARALGGLALAAIAAGSVVAGTAGQAEAYTGRFTAKDVLDAGGSRTAGNGYALNGRVYHCVGSSYCTW